MCLRHPAVAGWATRVDTGQSQWSYESTTVYNGSTTHDGGGDVSPPGMTSSLDELEFETGYDPAALGSLQSGLPFAGLSGYAAGGWSAGPSGEEGTIAYTPPPRF